MSSVLEWILDRLSEKSTWASLVTVAGSVIGATIAPEQKEAIITAGLGVATAIGVFVKEEK